MASCKKSEIGEIESVKLFDTMKKNGISVYKTDYLNIYIPANSFAIDRNLNSIGSKIVKMINDGLKTSNRVFVFFQLLWDEKANKHSTVLEVEKNPEDDVIHLRYFDSNGKLEIGATVVELPRGRKDITPKYTNDYNVNALLSKITDILREEGNDVEHENVMKHNVNVVGDGICDAFSLFYVKYSYENGYEAAKGYFNEHIKSLKKQKGVMNSTIVDYIRT